MGKANPSRSQDAFSLGRCSLEFQREALHLEVPQPALAKLLTRGVVLCYMLLRLCNTLLRLCHLSSSRRPAPCYRLMRPPHQPLPIGAAVPRCHLPPSKHAFPLLQWVQRQNSEVVSLNLPTYHTESFKPFSNRSPSYISKKTIGSSAGSCRFNVLCHETKACSFNSGSYRCLAILCWWESIDDNFSLKLQQ